tara:strand:+ start:3986 stop:4219 length:234 start_codon:yes stop_codon:yes gene_type:complete
MIYVFNSRQRADYLQTILTLKPAKTEEQAEVLKELIESYTSEIFPYQKEIKWKDSQKITEILEREMQKGPIAVVPQN